VGGHEGWRLRATGLVTTHRPIISSATRQIILLIAETNAVGKTRRQPLRCARAAHGVPLRRAGERAVCNF